MRKILIIIGTLRIGGAERVARDIGYYADPDKFSIHYLVYGNETGEYEAELKAKGCVIHHMDEPSQGYLAYCKNLSQLIKKYKYDVIHAHTMFSSGWAMLLGRIYGVKIRIAHSHAIKDSGKRGFCRNLYENVMRKIVVRNATNLVACGKSAGDWFYGAKTFKKRGQLIYNGIALKEFIYNDNARKSLREKYNIKEKFVIGHAGHLFSVKNQIFLVDLMPRIIEKKPNALLLLLGDGSDRDMICARIKELKLEKNILMLGNVENVGEFMSAMDIFVFPSLHEAMPLAMIEAQTNGLPCCISDKVPKDIYLTDLIHVHSLSDPDLWIKSICGLKRTDCEKYSKQMYDMGFDISDMVKKIYPLYE